MSFQADIVVVGAGAAGIAAATCAARSGCATLLMDQRPAVGGIGGFSGVTTLCGLYDDNGQYLNGGFSREFAGNVSDASPLKMGKVWVLPYRPERFREVAAQFFALLPDLQALWNTPVREVEVDGDRIVRINGVSTRAVIDCTGGAEVARAVGVACLETDESTQAPAVIFPLRKVSRSMKTSSDAVQVLLPLARAGLPPLSFQPSLEPGTLTVKFTGKAEQAAQVVEFLRAGVFGFENCEMQLSEVSESSRACRMIIGQHILTGSEVLAGQRFPDGLVRCAWPIEQWDAGGNVRFRHLSAGAYYEIPARSLRAARLTNLFMAGKTISADVDAIASARVMGCCLATGAAAATLAAEHLQSARP